MHYKHRKIEAFETEKVGYYNFQITYPKGMVKFLKDIPDKDLYLKIKNLKSNVISNQNQIWHTLQDWM